MIYRNRDILVVLNLFFSLAILVFLFASAVLTGEYACIDKCGEEVFTRTHLPQNAVFVANKGNGWVIFDMDGSRFLYRRSGSPYSAREAIALISKAPAGNGSVLYQSGKPEAWKKMPTQVEDNDK